MITAEEIIKILKLEKHPVEGGYFLETFRSKQILSCRRGTTGRVKLGTAIYYLLTGDTFSEMHRLKVDEIFHFYQGDPVEMLFLYPDKRGEVVILGNDINVGMRPQIFVPAGTWQGARMLGKGKFALMGTTTSPGFEYSDYQSGKKNYLSKVYPQFKELISDLTRQ